MRLIACPSGSTQPTLYINELKIHVLHATLLSPLKREKRMRIRRLHYIICKGFMLHPGFFGRGYYYYPYVRNTKNVMWHETTFVLIFFSSCFSSYSVYIYFFFVSHVGVQHSEQIAKAAIHYIIYYVHAKSHTCIIIVRNYYTLSAAAFEPYHHDVIVRIYIYIYIHDLRTRHLEQSAYILVHHIISQRGPDLIIAICRTL